MDYGLLVMYIFLVLFAVGIFIYAKDRRTEIKQEKVND